MFWVRKKSDLELEEHKLVIRCTPEVWRKFERFLSFFHFNGGHSSLFAIPFDGDGSDVLKVEPAPSAEAKEGMYELTTKGYDVEVANGKGFTGYCIDYDKK